MVSLSTKNYGTSQTKLLPFSTEVIVRLAKFAEFEEYHTKQGKIQIWKIVKTNIRHKRHDRSHSTQLRLIQYVHMRLS